MIKRDLEIKYDEETSPKFGRKPEDRPIQEYIKHGIVNINKPSGPSSHEVTAWAKKIIGVEHAGHGGTLGA
jgi:H/ACA ribonucleoprotein complex subunit 4